MVIAYGSRESVSDENSHNVRTNVFPPSPSLLYVRGARRRVVVLCCTFAARGVVFRRGGARCILVLHYWVESGGGGVDGPYQQGVLTLLLP